MNRRWVEDHPQYPKEVNATNLDERMRRRLDVIQSAIDGEHDPEWRFSKDQMTNLRNVLWEFAYMDTVSMGDLAERVR